jgi:hypothetical protein
MDVFDAKMRGSLPPVALTVFLASTVMPTLSAKDTDEQKMDNDKTIKTGANLIAPTPARPMEFYHILNQLTNRFRFLDPNTVLFVKVYFSQKRVF